MMKKFRVTVAILDRFAIKGYEALVWKQENFGFCSENERLDNINVHFELVE